MAATAGARVLVTGATSGLGGSLARMLKSRGYFVIALCRNEQQAQSLMREGVCNAAVLADLGDIATVQSVPRQLQALGIDALHGLLHCAAISGAAPIETTRLDEARELFEVNFFGPLALIQGTIPLLRKGRGRMVLTSSIAGFSIWPMLGMYGATKHAFEAMVDAARRELHPWGIQVSLIRPGGIKTRMLDRHVAEMDARLASLGGLDKALYSGLYEGFTKAMHDGHKKAVPPERFAKKMVDVFEARKPKTVYCLGTDCKMLRFIDLLFPDSFVDFISRRMFPVSRTAGALKQIEP